MSHLFRNLLLREIYSPRSFSYLNPCSFYQKVISVGPGISEKMLLASISTHLHLSKGTVTKVRCLFVFRYLFE
jgi:hypothetical protein